MYLLGNYVIYGCEADEIALAYGAVLQGITNNKCCIHTSTKDTRGLAATLVFVLAVLDFWSVWDVEEVT